MSERNRRDKKKKSGKADKSSKLSRPARAAGSKARVSIPVDGDEDIGKEFDDDSSSLGSGPPSPLKDIKTIWDDEYIKKTLVDDKESWQCLWCKQLFRGINATKALAHVSKSEGRHIKKCKGKIDDRYAERYRLLWVKSASRIDAKKRAIETLDENLASNQAAAAESLVAKKPRKYGSIPPTQTSLSAFLTERESDSNVTPQVAVAGGFQPTWKHMVQGRVTRE